MLASCPGCNATISLDRVPDDRRVHCLHCGLDFKTPKRPGWENKVLLRSDLPREPPKPLASEDRILLQPRTSLLEASRVAIGLVCGVLIVVLGVSAWYWLTVVKVDPPTVNEQTEDRRIPVVPVTIKPPPLEGDRVVRQLPAEFKDVCVAGGGRFLVFHLRKQFAIFDVNEGKFVKNLPVKHDTVRFAAGMDKLIVAYPITKELERWDLNSFEREASTELVLPERRYIAALAMGAASNGPLAVVGLRDTGNKGGRLQAGVVFVNPLTFNVIGVAPSVEKTLLSLDLHRDGVFSASADGRVFCGQCGEGKIATCLKVDGAQVTIASSASARFAFPGSTGQPLFTGTGLRSVNFDRIGKEQGFLDEYVRIPAQRGPLYFCLERAEVARGKAKAFVCCVGSDVPLGEFDFDGVFKMDAAGMPAKVLFFIPDAEVIIRIMPKQIVLRRFRLDDVLQGSNKNFLFVDSQPPSFYQRGVALDYCPTVKSKAGGVKMTLDVGPEGMSLSDGRLAWIPPNDADKEFRVRLKIRDASGQEASHDFTISRLRDIPRRPSIDPKAANIGTKKSLR